MHETNDPEGVALEPIDMQATLEHIDRGLELLIVTNLQIRDLLTALLAATGSPVGREIDELHDQGKLWNEVLPYLAAQPQAQDASPAKPTVEDE